MEHFSMRRRALRPLKIHYISRVDPRPSQSPRVDEPHLASIASTLSAVAGSARICVVQVVRDGASDTDGNHRKLADDTLNGNDVQDRFLVVKLINQPRANRFQPSYGSEHAIMSIIAITYIIVIITHNNYNMHNMYNCYNVYNYHYEDYRRFPRLRRGHTRRSWIQCLS